MKSRPSVAVVRRWIVARCVAAFLVVLTVAPFTAPFATLDVAEVVGERLLHVSVLSTVKSVQDLSTISAPAAGQPGAVALESPLVVVGVRQDTDLRAIRPLVLRI